jgi:putative ABC transport system permease protein
LLLLIAAVNVANLPLARATSRSREFAIRVAIGASRWDLVRQALLEGVVLAAAGGVAGLVLSIAASRVLQVAWPLGVLRPPTFHPDWRVFLFLAVVSFVTALLFCMAPALQASMTSLNEALKEGRGRLLGGGKGAVRNVLVVSEIAVACVLLIGAGLLLKSFARLMTMDPGFHAENVLTMSVALPGAKYKEDSQKAAFFKEAIEGLKALPGAVAAGAISDLPLGGANVNGDIEIVGRTFPRDRKPVADKIIVTPDYFRAIGMRLLRGRWFNELDGTKGHAAVIINEAMSREFWPNENPIGKLMKVQYPISDVQEIVGVVADVKSTDLAAKPTCQTYVPYPDLPAGSMSLVVRTTADPARITRETRQVIRAIDPEQPLAGIQTMQQVVSNSLGSRRMSAGIVGMIAFLALTLASIGIYGAVSYWVSQRTREIGIRNALGARHWDIVELVVGRAMLLVASGVAAGLAGSFVLTRYLSSLLFGVGAHDWATMAAVPVLLAAVALAACSIPALSATRVDPVVALRFE